jgi:hypothetical protein
MPEGNEYKNIDLHAQYAHLGNTYISGKEKGVLINYKTSSDLQER